MYQIGSVQAVRRGDVLVASSGFCEFTYMARIMDLLIMRRLMRTKVTNLGPVFLLLLIKQ